MSNQEYIVGYIFSITQVATLGGLLFGYDTAFISGAEKSVQQFLITSQGLNSVRLFSRYVKFE